MSFTALNRGVVILSLTLLSGTVLARGAMPRIVQDPVFGLRYEAAKATFDPLPKALLAQCPDLFSATPSWKGHYWVFASVHDAGRQYLVLGGGYFERLHPTASESAYLLDRIGGVISIEGAQCIAFGQAREVFDARYFVEIPQPVLQQLAVDLATTLARSFGGPIQLAEKFRQQHINLERLPPELAAAFASYSERKK